MISKLFEVRDCGTTIPVMAIQMNADCDQEIWLLSRAGFSESPITQGEYIMLVQIDGGGGQALSDPYKWNIGRTMHVAHKYLRKSFHDHSAGDVIDVEFILGETSEPKTSERKSL